jgi:hypothetical protein
MHKQIIPSSLSQSTIGGLAPGEIQTTDFQKRPRGTHAMHARQLQPETPLLGQPTRKKSKIVTFYSRINMNSLKYLITTIAFFYSATALPFSLPVAEDTFTTPHGLLTPANGRAPTLLLNANQAGLVKFDLSALPAAFNATNILSATLKIYVNRAVTPGDLDVLLITSAWTESVPANAAMPDVNPSPISTVPASKIVGKRFIIIDVTPAVVGAVSGTSTNFGFLLRDTVGLVRIASKESPLQGPSAQLDIDANLALDSNGGNVFPGSVSIGANLNLAGLLRQGSETGPAAPSGRGLILRRLESTNATAGTVVARTDTLTLERDGTLRGWRIVNTANPGYAAISAVFLGVDSRQIWKTIALPNPSTPGTNVLFSEIDLPTPLLHFRCTFGNAYELGHHTEVSLFSSDSSSPNWVGTIFSSYNQ